jgi:hypothetical protein
MSNELWKAAEVIRGGLGVGMIYAERVGYLDRVREVEKALR